MSSASIIGVLGGLITLIVGALVAAGQSIPSYGISIGDAVTVGWAGVVVGIILLIAAAMFGKSKAAAGLGVILGIIGLVAGLGVVIGPLLGLIGGALAFRK